MAKYLILIYEDEAGYAAAGDEGFQAAMSAHQEFGQWLGSRLLGGDALQPQATATTIRADGVGGQVVSDGPFAETKEALGGYYLVEAADLDEAIEIGKRCPAPHGGVEVRPVMVFS